MFNPFRWFRKIRSIELLDLKPGDIVVLKTNGDLDPTAIARIEKMWRAVCPDQRVHLVVVPRAVDLSVVRPPILPAEASHV